MDSNVISLETDYLVIGAGVSGMAFVDELITNTCDIKITIVDKHSKPGGHWNDAYNFVTLHQPAEYYGVNSKKLGKSARDLATYYEINAYYEFVMKELLGSGRVKFFPQCEYKGNGEFHSLVVPNLRYNVKVRKKTVDATIVGPTIPSTRKPEYEVLEGVNLVPINELSKIQFPWKRYVIIGGGKTGIDAVLFLLHQSVDPDHIVWVIPNDYWLLNREMLFADAICTSTVTWLNCIMNSDTIDEYYKKGEDFGFHFRLDPSIEPTRMKAGTVTSQELRKLRLIKNIIRKGRISRIEPTRIMFENGQSEIETSTITLHVDCSACGLPLYSPQKIFDGNKITLQLIAVTQAAYSSCVIAAYESHFPDDEERKNKELTPIPHPRTPADYVAGLVQHFRNEKEMGNSLGLRWILRCRLQPLHHVSSYALVKFIAYFMFYQSTIMKALEKMLNNN